MSKQTMIIVPHPDDETLAFSHIIMNEVAAGNPLKIVVVTTGDEGGADQYGDEIPRLRMAEILRAMEIFGIPKEDLIILGYGDKLTLTNAFEDTENPDKCYPSGQRYQYRETYGFPEAGCNDFRFVQSGYHHPYTRNAILKDIIEVISLYHPTDIFTVSECDIHRDHRATYRFVTEALHRIQQDDKTYRPNFYISLVHFDKDLWPYDDASHFPDPFKGLDQKPFDWDSRIQFLMTDEMKEKKKRAIGEFTTQLAYSREYLEKFNKEDEFYVKELIHLAE